MNSAAVFTSISGLSLAGITIKDLSNIPLVIEARDCPILIPQPAGTVEVQQAQMMTFGDAVSRYWEVNRVYRWAYLHAPVGLERTTVFPYMAAMTAAQDLIVETFVELALIGIDVQTVEIGEFGPIQSPNGETFLGFTVSLTVREQINP